MVTTKEQTINAIRTFCHAQVREDGTVDPNQPYMGVITITVFRGIQLSRVNILANSIIELRVVQPGINYPVRIIRLRNGALKQFNSTKKLFTAFNTQGTDLNYSDHFGTGFSEFINQGVIEQLLTQIPPQIDGGKKPFVRVVFTVDNAGKVHHLEYKRLEQELTEEAKIAADAGSIDKPIQTSYEQAQEQQQEEEEEV